MLFRAVITVTGRVQGVGFRFFVQESARSLPEVTGFVRNAWDTRLVEVEAEGTRDILERFVALLREGSSLSRIDDISVRWYPADQRRFDDFTIEH